MLTDFQHEIDSGTQPRSNKRLLRSNDPSIGSEIKPFIKIEATNFKLKRESLGLGMLPLIFTSCDVLRSGSYEAIKWTKFTPTKH